MIYPGKLNYTTEIQLHLKSFWAFNSFEDQDDGGSSGALPPRWSLEVSQPLPWQSPSPA